MSKQFSEVWKDACRAAVTCRVQFRLSKLVPRRQKSENDLYVVALLYNVRVERQGVSQTRAIDRLSP